MTKLTYDNAYALKNQKSIWYPNINLDLGYCYTFDVNLDPRLKTASMLNGNPLIKFEANTNKKAYLKMLIHDHMDLPDAEVLHNYYTIAPQGKKYRIKISKRMIESVSTKKRPCQNYTKVDFK